MMDGQSKAGLGSRTRGFALLLLPLLIVTYAGLLRLDALVERYGTVAGPEPVEAAQQSAVTLAKSIRPPGFEWRYTGVRRGDPVSYLKIARMRPSFYEASFREPLYVASVGAFLRLTGDQDIAVSCASALYSTLLVLATYLVGSFAFGRWIGAGAALLLAVEARVVLLGVDGWRDDAFAFFVLMSAYALLRAAREPSLGAGLLLGLVSAGAMLTRITSFTFLLPCFLWLIVSGPRRDVGPRFSAISVAILTAVLLVGPYVLQCLVVYGDPLIAINFATERFYPTVGDASTASPSWSGFLQRLLGHRPLATIDTVLRGLTVYPFGNKWEGLRHLGPWLASTLSIAALLGLVMFVASIEGRLLLVLLFSALAPFAITWEIPGGGEWRFTLFAYPFYLVAAGLALSRGFALIRAAAREGPMLASSVDRRVAAAAVACLVCAVVGAYEIPRY